MLSGAPKRQRLPLLVPFRQSDTPGHDGHSVSLRAVKHFPSRDVGLYSASMWTLIIVLLVAWAIVAIVGFVFEGLLWLAVIGAVLFVGTLIIGIIRQRSRRPSA